MISLPTRNSEETPPPILDLVVIALIQAYLAYLYIGDITYQLAFITGDDGLVALSVAFKYPEYFAKDIYFSWSQTVGLSSILNLAPALLYKYLNIDPLYMHYAAVYFQLILRPLVAYLLVWAMWRNRAAAWCSAIFVEAVKTLQFNLAWFSLYDFIPYVGHMGPIVLWFSAALMLMKAQRSGYAAYLVGSAIHPINGLLFGFMMSCGWLLYGWRHSQYKEAFKNVGLFAALFCVSAIPALLISSGPGAEKLWPPEIIQPLLTSPHLSPWRGENFAPHFFYSAAYLGGLYIVAWYISLKIEDRLQFFIQGILLGAAVASVAHYFVVKFEMLSVVHVISTRATYVMNHYLPAVIFGYLCASLFKQTDSSPLYGLSCLALMAINTPFGMAAVAVMLVLRKHLRLAAVLALLLAAASYALRENLISLAAWGNWPRTLHLRDYKPLYWMTMTMLGACLIYPGTVFSRQTARLGLAVCLPLLLFICVKTMYQKAYWSGYASRNVEQTQTAARSDYIALQLWALENTTPDSGFLFIDPGEGLSSWRSLTRRPVIILYPHIHIYGYNVMKRDYARRLASWFAENVDESIPQENWPYYDFLKVTRLVRAMDPEMFGRLGRALGINYAIVRTTSTDYDKDLPVVYENRSFTVLKIQ